MRPGNPLQLFARARAGSAAAFSLLFAGGATKEHTVYLTASDLFSIRSLEQANRPPVGSPST